MQMKGGEMGRREVEYAYEVGKECLVRISGETPEMPPFDIGGSIWHVLHPSYSGPLFQNAHVRIRRIRIPVLVHSGVYHIQTSYQQSVSI